MTILLTDYTYGTAYKISVPDNVEDVEAYLFGDDSPFNYSNCNYMVLGPNDDIITIKNLHRWMKY